MSELDDLFRQQLDGHASEPGPDLWARLQARTAAEAASGAAPPEADPLDARFRAGLAGHATPPRRELWERLEDEHLRPRQRRRPVVAWGRLAVVASLLLLVLAGGAGLWWTARNPASGPVATAGRGAAGRPATSPRASVAHEAVPAEGTAATSAPEAAATTATKALATAPLSGPAGAQAAAEQAMPATPAGPRRAATGVVAAQIADRKKNQNSSATQATDLGASPSSSTVASTAAQHRPATALGTVPGHQPTTPQPDAAAGTQLVLGRRKAPGSQPSPLITQPETPALAAAQPPMQVIEVEVRRGSRPAPAETPVVAVAAPAPTEADVPQRPHLRLGGLLRQAGHALRGEQVSLAEATGLPETVTVQAHLGDRVLSRTIRL